MKEKHVVVKHEEHEHAAVSIHVSIRTRRFILVIVKRERPSELSFRTFLQNFCRWKKGRGTLCSWSPTHHDGAFGTGRTSVTLPCWDGGVGDLVGD